MISNLIRSALLAVLTSGLALGANSSAPSSRDGSDSARSVSASAARGGRPPARGILPDPVLLDGSGQPADENTRSGKVGGQQGQPPQQGGAGGQQMPQGTRPPSGGSSGQQQANSQEAQQGGAQSPQGAQANAPQSANAPAQGGTDGAISGPADPNAKAEGVQVGQLGAPGPDGEAGAPDGTAASKPQPVAIGDSAMQIKSVANAPGIVGAAVPAGQTQQMEKGVGGGRGSSAVGGGRNASEKGRAMPAGL